MEPPNQYDTERLLSDVLSHGDKAKLANFLGVSPSEICQQFNPEETKKSDYYRFKRMLFWLKTEINIEAARTIFADLHSSYDSWQKPSCKHETLAALVVAADKEAGEVIQSWAANKPLHEQRKETVEAIAALQRHLEGLNAQASNVKEMRSK